MLVRRQRCVSIATFKGHGEIHGYAIISGWAFDSPSGHDKKNNT